jgi:peptidoglycan hydrolase-like protein with peptidoglycan-binding domain
MKHPRHLPARLGLAAAFLCVMPLATAMAAAPAKPAMTKPVVMAVQRALNKDGAGLRVDGIAGPKTERAVLNYQSAHGLKTTGKIDPALEKRLGVG